MLISPMGYPMNKAQVTGPALLRQVPALALLGLLIWRVLLDTIYVTFISPSWRYAGLTCSYDMGRCALAWVVFLMTLPSLANMIARKTPSDLGMVLLYLVSFMPGLTVVSYAELEQGFQLAFYVFWIGFIAANAVFPHMHFRSVSKRHGLLVYGLATGVCSLVILFVWARYAHFRINLSLLNVYDLRADASEFNMPTILSYLYAACRGLAPVLLGYSLVRRNSGVILWNLVLTLLLFSVDGVKSVVFSAVVVIAAFFIVKKTIEPSIFIYCFAALAIFAFMMSLFGFSYATETLLRRVAYLPNYLASAYYELSVHSGPDYFRQGFLRLFGAKSQYDIPLAQLVGSTYYIGGNANTGLLADAVMNLGVVGPLLYPLLLVGLLRIAEACADELPPFISSSCMILLVWHLTNSFFMTALLTHGVLAMFVLTYFLPREPMGTDR